MPLRTIRRALLSVSDKSGLIELARGLSALGVELISTGGTRKQLADAGLPVRDVAEVTGFPEMLDGRVKTLHPTIHGGILAIRDNADHLAALQKHGIAPIDLVVCNLYPFEATVGRPGSTEEEIIEDIDIGGPTLVRAAAKNFHDVAVVTSPQQYAGLLAELHQHQGALSLAVRHRLAAEAFARIAAYDQAVSSYFASAAEAEPLPILLHRRWEKRSVLRYGENPHQKASFYVDPAFTQPCVANARVLHGKELSFNNLLDLDSALGLVREFEQPAAVVIKHNNPCGAAVGATLVEAFGKAYEGDPVSAYGGVLAFNRPVDEATAQQITEPQRFIECILAPDFTPEALHLLTTRPSWKKSVRLLAAGPLQGAARSPWALREIEGGLLLQERDLTGAVHDFREARVVTKRQPSEAELLDLRFTWVVCKHVKSNAIVLGHGGQIVGVGAGQMSRVDSVHMAVRKAGERRVGAVLASDAFFPFRDNVDAAASAGVTALVQPGGSMRDAESVQACDEHGLAMVFTGVRHFRH
jgi:phosphoribosylaminoimidazolecarboxamide formyltransferase / IMP cyclohydrolase